MKTDIKITDNGFEQTTVTVEPITEQGKQFFASVFGHGVVSVEMPKSKAIDLAVFAERKAINVSEGQAMASLSNAVYAESHLNKMLAAEELGMLRQRIESTAKSNEK